MVEWITNDKVLLEDDHKSCCEIFFVGFYEHFLFIFKISKREMFLVVQNVVRIFICCTFEHVLLTVRQLMKKFLF